MERKILLRTEVTIAEHSKTYMIQFGTQCLTSAKFVGLDENNIQRWVINKKVHHQNASKIYVEKVMISGDNDEYVFLLSRTFSKNRIDGEFELKLVEKLMWDWEIDELTSYKKTLDNIIENKKAGTVEEVTIERKYYVIDPDGKKHTVKTNALAERSMIKMESGWQFSGTNIIPSTISAKDQKKWCILPVLEEK